MSHEDDKAQMEFLADPMRVREQIKLELVILPLVILLSIPAAMAVAWVLIQLMLLANIGGM